MEAPLPGGPVLKRVPNFTTLAVGPGERLPAGWTFISLGCWDATEHHGHGLEFFLIAPDYDERHIESLGMNAYYHAGPEYQRLDVGHTVPIGRPWIDGSQCDHYLASLPYPFGPDLEICTWGVSI
jgi:hypothetical protein